MEFNRNVHYQLLAQHPNLPSVLIPPAWTLALFQLVEILHTGYVSQVYKAIDQRTKGLVAVKLYLLDKLDELSLHQVLREISIHASLQHDNIITLYAAFKEGNTLALVQEFADGGDLYRLMRKYKGKRLSERTAVRYVIGPFLRAVSYMHNHGIVHRDVKPENLLFSRDMCLKIADFGLAIDLNAEPAVTRLGTIDFMAPEVLKCPDKHSPSDNKDRTDVAYGPKVDAWAVGAMAYELLVGRPPFSGPSAVDKVRNILEADPLLPGWLSPDARDFVAQALTKSHSLRPSVHDLSQHKWVLDLLANPSSQ